MSSVVKTRSIMVVWVVLVMATLASWVVGEGEGATPHRGATLAILGLAFIKVSIIGLHFMEIREAPAALRIVFEVWVTGTAAALAVTFLVVG